MTAHTEYIKLRDEFLAAAREQINVKDLAAIKDCYSRRIRSKRQLSYAEDLKGVIRLLEKRDILCCDDIKPLLYISDTFLKDSQLRSKLIDYDKRLEGVECLPLCNMYLNANEVSVVGSVECRRNLQTGELSSAISGAEKVELVAEVSSIQLRSMSNIPQGLPQPGSSSGTSTQADKDAQLKLKVLLHVSERLGNSWRDVARFLNITESQINTIQNQYPNDLRKQSYEAVKICISQYDSNLWKFNLMCALEKGRRRDLKETVEKLIIHTI